MGAIASRLDNLNLGSCAWFPQSEKRNAIASIVAGLLFFTGWWFLIDVQSVYPEVMSVGYHFCGVVGSISLLMINSVSNSQVRGDSYSTGRCGPRGARLWLFIGFVMGFGALIASCWILFANFVAKSDLPSHWPGAGLFLSNVFIFAGSLIYKFCRTEEQF